LSLFVGCECAVRQQDREIKRFLSMIAQRMYRKCWILCRDETEIDELVR